MKSFDELFKEQFGDFLFKEKPRGAVKANQNACTGAMTHEQHDNQQREHEWRERLGDLHGDENGRDPGRYLRRVGWSGE